MLLRGRLAPTDHQRPRSSGKKIRRLGARRSAAERSVRRGKHLRRGQSHVENHNVRQFGPDVLLCAAHVASCGRLRLAGWTEPERVAHKYPLWGTPTQSCRSGLLCPIGLLGRHAQRKRIGPLCHPSRMACLAWHAMPGKFQAKAGDQVRANPERAGSAHLRVVGK